MYKYKSRSYRKLVAIKLGMWVEAYAQNDCHPQGNPTLSYVGVGIAWHPAGNIGAGELKSWMLRHSKNPVSG